MADAEARRLLELADAEARLAMSKDETRRLLELPDETLLDIFARLPDDEQLRLSTLHSRFAQLYNEPRLWRARLARDYALPAPWLAVAEARAAQLGDKDARALARPGWSARSSKRVYELLRRNERALLRYLSGARTHVAIGTTKVRDAVFVAVPSTQGAPETLAIASLVTSPMQVAVCRIAPTRVEVLHTVDDDVFAFKAVSPAQDEVIGGSRIQHHPARSTAVFMSTREPFARVYVPLERPSQIMPYMEALSDGAIDEDEDEHEEREITGACYAADGRAAIFMVDHTFEPPDDEDDEVWYYASSLHVLVRGDADTWQPLHAALSPAEDPIAFNAGVRGSTRDHGSTLIGALSDTDLLVRLAYHWYLIYSIDIISRETRLRLVIPTRRDFTPVIAAPFTFCGIAPREGKYAFWSIQLRNDVDGGYVRSWGPELPNMEWFDREIVVVGPGRVIVKAGARAALLALQPSGTWRIVETHHNAAMDSTVFHTEAPMYSPDMGVIAKDNGVLMVPADAKQPLLSCEMSTEQRMGGGDGGKSHCNACGARCRAMCPCCARRVCDGECQYWLHFFELYPSALGGDSDDDVQLGTDASSDAQQGMQPPYAQQGMQPPYAQQGMQPPYAQQGMQPPYAQQGAMPPQGTVPGAPRRKSKWRVAKRYIASMAKGGAAGAVRGAVAGIKLGPKGAALMAAKGAAQGALRKGVSHTRVEMERAARNRAQWAQQQAPQQWAQQ